MFHGRALWVTLAVVAALEVAGVVGIWLSAGPDGQAINPGNSYDLVVGHSAMWTASRPLPVIAASVLAVVLVREDAETGFDRTLHPFCRSRLGMCVARLAAVLVGTLLVMCAVVAATEAAYRALGFEVVTSEASRELAYLGLYVLCTLAYALLAAAVAELARSTVAGVTFGVLVGSSLLGSLVQMVLAGVGPTWPLAADVALWLPSIAQSGGLLASGADKLWAAAPMAGMAAPAHLALVLGLWALAACAGTLATAARRDVA